MLKKIFTNGLRHIIVESLKSLCCSNIKQFSWRIAAVAVIHLAASDEETRQEYDLNFVYGVINYREQQSIAHLIKH